MGDQMHNNNVDLQQEGEENIGQKGGK